MTNESLCRTVAPAVPAKSVTRTVATKSPWTSLYRNGPRGENPPSHHEFVDWMNS
jgi:hypothetical protein